MKRLVRGPDAEAQKERESRRAKREIPAFILSFEADDPDWSRFPLEALAELPAPQFKLMNIRKFREAGPERPKAVLGALEKALI